MQLGKSIRHNTLWLFTGNMSQKILEFITGVILARLLFPEDFGILVTVQVFTGTAGLIAGGGMGQALIQAKQVDKRHFQVVFTLQLLICSMIYAFFFHIAPLFADWFNTSVYTDLLRVSALSFILRPFNNVAKAKLSREMRFKAITLISVMTHLITISVSIYLALNGYGVWSLVLSGIFSSLFSTISLILTSKFYPKIHFEGNIARTLGKYGAKATTNDIIQHFKQQAPNFIIGKFSGATAVGLFNKGESLSTLPIQTISGSVYQTIFRALSSIQDNLDQSKYIYLRTITLVTTYTFPFYLGLLWVAEPFIITIYGERWQLAAVPLQILSIAGFFRCITNPSGAVMDAQNLLSTEIKIQLTALILTTAGCIYGTLHNSLLLISLGLLPSALFLSFALSFCVLRKLDITYADFFQALRPALKLNICLLIVLIITDGLFKMYIPTMSTEMYLLSLSASGALSYIIFFLFIPIPALKKEVQRWKNLLRIPATNLRRDIQ